ncbi:DUF881 domain-containing protein [Propionicicella superfundia]|uniref:DUF881 domain-containing protein n=1 Tax=Propionicicella superfundia TaxID=348582 RepID=UPI0003FC536F|nr:DUF881 domain-containing protein [Propionicicella superfundia]
MPDDVEPGVATGAADDVPPVADDAAPETSADASGSAERGPVTWRELGHDFIRPGRGQVVLAAILLVVGMALVMQFRTNTAAAPYESLRRSDLVQLLDNLNQESRRLSEEITEQNELKQQLESGAGQEEVARKEAQARLETLRILAGTAPATGTGIVMVIQDPEGRMTADILLNAIEELRDAGAEVIEINDSIRVVASTWVTTGSDGILVDGRLVRTPITIEAIGDPHSLEEGARFRGGLVSEVEGQRVNGSVTITRSEKVTIASLHTAPTNQYARPA